MSELLVTNLKNNSDNRLFRVKAFHVTDLSIPRTRLIGLQAFAMTLLMSLASVSFASDLVDMLEKMSAVSQSRNYQGTFILRKSDKLSTLRVQHGMDKRGVWESLETLDGEVRKVIRQNNKVISIFPEQKLLTIRSNSNESSLHQKLPDNIKQLGEYYTFERLENDRVAGYPALVLDLKPKDKYRYGYRYWLEHESGMLLRCDLLDSNKDIVEQMMFTNLEYLDNTPKTAFSDFTLKGYTIKNLDQTSHQLSHSEWQVTDPPDGFRLTQSFQRGLTPKINLLQLVYSDGLASVSIFIEELDQDSQHLDGASSMGAVHAFGNQIDDHYVTVVGEVPEATVMRMARSTRHRASNGLSDQ